jgi:hypothetical protein
VLSANKGVWQLLPKIGTTIKHYVCSCFSPFGFRCSIDISEMPIAKAFCYCLLFLFFGRAKSIVAFGLPSSTIFIVDSLLLATGVQ